MIISLIGNYPSPLDHILQPAVWMLRLSRWAPPRLAPWRVPARPKSSRALPDGLAVSGVPLLELVRRPRAELAAELGDAKLRAVRQSLPQRWRSLAAAGKVPAPVVGQAFQAASRLELPKLMMETFEYADEHYPLRVDFVMYGEVFNLLARSKQADAIRAIYDRVKDRFDDKRPAPEIVYRFGIYAKLGQQDFDGVETLVRDMKANGIGVSNEVVSRIMLGLAKAGKEQSVLEIFASLDHEVGRWHPADVDRVVTSLGQVGHADAAFDFYRESEVRLSANTLLALLGVCEKNNRPKHAMALLANRKRFNLMLNTRQYNKVLEALEFFDMRQEIGNILKEMTSLQLSFDVRTKEIIARNQDALRQTQFAVASKAVTSASGSQKRSRQVDEPLVRDLMAKRAYKEVAAMVDGFLKPVTLPESEKTKDNGSDSTQVSARHATTVPGWLAAPAVTAYFSIGERHKLLKLLQGFGLVKNPSAERALNITVRLASTSNNPRDVPVAYQALKAIQQQGYEIMRPRDAIECFRHHRDVDAAIALCQQMIRQLNETLRGENEAGNDANRAANFNRVLNSTLQMLVDSHELSGVVDLLNEIEFLDFHISGRDYATIFSAMRVYNQSAGNQSDAVIPYDATDFEMIWKDMKHREVTPTKQIIGNICGPIKSRGSPSMQRSVVDVYLQIALDKRGASEVTDSYVMPLTCFTALLEMASRHMSTRKVLQLYNDAVSHIHQAGSVTHARPSVVRSVHRDWATICVAKMISSDDVDGAYDVLMDMPSVSGGEYSHIATVTVLKALTSRARSAADDEKMSKLIMLLRGQFQKMQRFELKTKALEDIAKIAISSGDVRLGFKILELLSSNSSSRANETTKGGKRSTDAAQQDADRLLKLYLQLQTTLSQSEADTTLREEVDRRVHELSVSEQKES